jgi:hypothetical protein
MAKKKRGRPAKKTAEVLSPETKKGILVVVIFLIALLSLLSLLDLAGSFGVVADHLLGKVFGWGKWPFPLLMLAWGFILLNPDKYLLKPSNYIGLIMTMISGTGLLELIYDFKNVSPAPMADKGGGYIGFAVNQPLQQIMGGFATLVILLGLFIIFLLISFNISLDELGNKVNVFRLIWLKIKNALENRPVRSRYEEDYKQYEAPAEMEEEVEEIVDEAPMEVDQERLAEAINEPIELIKPEKPKKYPSKVNVPIDLLEVNGSKPLAATLTPEAKPSAELLLILESR